MALASLLGAKAKGTPLASPASTAAPSPTERRFTGESDYICLSESSSPDEWPAVIAKTRHAFYRATRRMAVPLLLLGAILACPFAIEGATVWAHAPAAPLARATPSPRIWDPDLRVEFQMEPLAKSVVRKFDAYNMARGGRDSASTFNANVAHYLAPDLLYESVGFGTWRTPAGWARGEENNYGMAFPETVFTQMLFFGDRNVSTTTTYGTAFWGGELFGIEGPKRWVNLRITDFYRIREDKPGWGRVAYNFMMIDWADVMRQVGRPVLPPATLEEGLVLPPAANDGVPAPLSALVQAESRDAKVARAVAETALHEDWSGEEAAAAQSWHPDLTYYGPGGIGLARNATAYREHVLAPFRQSFADRRVAVELFTCEGNYCAVLGRVQGRGRGRWLGLPCEGREVALRFAMHYRVVGGKVREGWTILDFPGFFQQLGLDFYGLAAAGGH